MAYRYNQPDQSGFGSYGGAQNVYGQAQQFTVDPQQGQQQQQPRINPMQAYKAYQRLSGLGGTSTTAGASPALLSTGGGVAGLGGSGLIGSAGGATSAGATGGASYGLGGSLVGGTGTVGGSTFAGSAGAAGTGAAAGGASGGAAAGTGASTAASSGPWGWLALAIIANETYQGTQGNRDQGTAKQIEHAFTGKVVEDDVDTWGQMVDKDNKLGIKGDMQVAADFSTGDFSNAFKGLEDTFGVKTIKKLF